MRSFGPATTVLITIGFFALNTFSAPWGPWNGTPSKPNPPTQANAAPATSSSPSSSSSSSDSTTSDTPTSGSTTPSSGGTGKAGYATIVNKCSFPTYVYVCKQHPATCGSTTTMAASTGGYSEPYAPASDGGHSLKISTAEGSGNILQFEYTNGGDGTLSYDLSEVNGNPFGSDGFSLTNTTTDAYCAPPCTSCPAIFTAPTDGIPYTASTSDGVGAILCG